MSDSLEIEINRIIDRQVGEIKLKVLRAIGRHEKRVIKEVQGISKRTGESRSINIKPQPKKEHRRSVSDSDSD